MSFSRQAASGGGGGGGLVTLKYVPYSSQYCRKTRGNLGGSTDQKVSKIFEKLYFVESSTESLHNKEK